MSSTGSPIGTRTADRVTWTENELADQAALRGAEPVNEPHVRREIAVEEFEVGSARPITFEPDDAYRLIRHAVRSNLPEDAGDRVEHGDALGSEPSAQRVGSPLEEIEYAGRRSIEDRSEEARYGSAECGPLQKSCSRSAGPKPRVFV